MPFELSSLHFVSHGVSAKTGRAVLPKRFPHFIVYLPRLPFPLIQSEPRERRGQLRSCGLLGIRYILASGHRHIAITEERVPHCLFFWFWHSSAVSDWNHPHPNTPSHPDCPWHCLLASWTKSWKAEFWWRGVQKLCATSRTSLIQLIIVVELCFLKYSIVQFKPTKILHILYQIFFYVFRAMLKTFIPGLIKRLWYGLTK